MIRTHRKGQSDGYVKGIELFTAESPGLQREAGFNLEQMVVAINSDPEVSPSDEESYDMVPINPN